MINTFIVLFLASLLLTACSTNDDYLQAKTLPPVNVPDGLDKTALGQIYHIPEGDGRKAGRFQKPLPPTLSGRQRIRGPEVDSVDDEIWTVIPKDAASTWSQLLIYLNTRRIQMVKQDPINATIETGWIIEAAPPGTAIRYELRLESGLHSDLTEIHAVNLVGNLQTKILRDSQWPTNSDNVVHEKWFLESIARGISAQKPQGDSLLASNISFEEKVTVGDYENEPVLRMNLSVARAHKALLKATTSNNEVVAVLDEDAQQGLIYFAVKKVKAKKKKKDIDGLVKFLAALPQANLGKDASESDSDLSTVLENLSKEDSVSLLFPHLDLKEGNVPKENAKDRRKGLLFVERTLEDQQYIFVRDAYGRQLPFEEAKELLALIKQRLH